MRASQRGFSLLTVMIVLMVMLLLVAGALSFTGQEVASASQHVRREIMSACATAARNYIMSQIRAGADVTNLSIAGQLDLGDYLIRTGHLDSDPLQPPPVAAQPCPMGTAGGGMVDLTNRTLGLGGATGRKCYRVVVTCTDVQTQTQREVEFGVTTAL